MGKIQTYCTKSVWGGTQDTERGRVSEESCRFGFEKVTKKILKGSGRDA